MEAAQTKLWRAVRREVSRASRVGPSDSSAASVSSGDDAGLSPEFVATAHAVNAALARAVADEVEEQLTDVLMCLGEESTKARILEHALTRFDVHVPRLLREAGYSPENSPPGSRGASPAARDAAARDSPFKGDIPGDGDDLMYAHLLPPGVARSGGQGRKAARNEDVSPEPGLAALRALSAERRRGQSPDAPPFEAVAPRETETETGGAKRAPGGERGGESKREPETFVTGRLGSLTEPPSPVEAVAAEARAAASAALFDVADANERRNRRVGGADAVEGAVGFFSRDVEPEPEPEPIEPLPAARTRDTDKKEKEKAAGLDTPPEEEGARPAVLSEDWDTSEEDETKDDADEDDLGYSSFSSESSRGGLAASRAAYYVTDAPDDVREVSRRARQRARARLEVGQGVGPNILEGYYGRDGRRGGDADATFLRGETETEIFASSSSSRARGAFGFVADEDGESRSVIYAEGSVPGEALAPGVLSPDRSRIPDPGDGVIPGTARGASPGTGTDVGSALFRRVAGTVRAAARVARPALMTMPVRQRHWMEIYESTF